MALSGEVVQAARRLQSRAVFFKRQFYGDRAVIGDAAGQSMVQPPHSPAEVRGKDVRLAPSLGVGEAPGLDEDPVQLEFSDRDVFSSGPGRLEFYRLI